MDLALTSPRSPSPKDSAGLGFSLLEAMIAGVLLLAIILGIQPLLTRSTINNVAGFDYTRVTNMARSRAEQFHQLDFNSVPLTLTSGTELRFDEYFDQATGQWKSGTVDDATGAGDTALWTRVTTVRQFGINDLTTPLDAAAPAGGVHVKEILVAIEPTSGGGPLGPRKRTTVRFVKAR